MHACQSIQCIEMICKWLTVWCVCTISMVIHLHRCSDSIKPKPHTLTRTNSTTLYHWVRAFIYKNVCHSFVHLWTWVKTIFRILYIVAAVDVAALLLLIHQHRFFLILWERREKNRCQMRKKTEWCKQAPVNYTQPYHNVCNQCNMCAHTQIYFFFYIWTELSWTNVVSR